MLVPIPATRATVNADQTLVKFSFHILSERGKNKVCSSENLVRVYQLNPALQVGFFKFSKDERHGIVADLVVRFRLLAS